jgi:hypothetical protein
MLGNSLDSGLQQIEATVQIRYGVGKTHCWLICSNRHLGTQMDGAWGDQSQKPMSVGGPTLFY